MRPDIRWLLYDSYNTTCESSLRQPNPRLKSKHKAPGVNAANIEHKKAHHRRQKICYGNHKTTLVGKNQSWNVSISSSMPDCMMLLVEVEAMTV